MRQAAQGEVCYCEITHDAFRSSFNRLEDLGHIKIIENKNRSICVRIKDNTIEEIEFKVGMNNFIKISFETKEKVEKYSELFLE